MLLVGVASIGVHWVTRGVAERQTVQYLLLERSLDRFELAVAQSHLWLEEMLAGDEEIDSEVDVWGNLEEGLQVSRGLSVGGLVPGVGELRRLEDPAFQRLATLLHEDLLAFKWLSEQREREGV